MGVKYLNLTEGRMCDEDASSRFANKPVPSDNIERRTVQRVRMYSRGDYWKSREDC